MGCHQGGTDHRLCREAGVASEGIYTCTRLAFVLAAHLSEGGCRNNRDKRWDTSFNRRCALHSKRAIALLDTVPSPAGSALRGVFAFSGALQEAFSRNAPVLVFCSWAPSGSLPASVASLMLCAPARLRRVPLNLELGFAPYTTVDSVALGLERFAIRRIADARNGARVYRFERRTAYARDLINSDWDYALQRLCREQPDRCLGINSYLAVDCVETDGTVIPGTRPVIGNRVRRGEQRLPRLLGLRARNSSTRSVRRVADTDLLLINLHQGRGVRTAALTHEVLSTRAVSRPTIILAENASELARFMECPLLRAVNLSLGCGPCPSPLNNDFVVIGRERVQHEQEFRFALPVDDLTDEEQNLVHLAFAAWRSRWRGLQSSDHEASALTAFRRTLSELRRTQPSIADRFTLADRIFDRLSPSIECASRARLQAVVSLVEEFAETQPHRIALLVGSRTDQQFVASLLAGRKWASRLTIDLARNVADTRDTADVCVLCGYFGPLALDAAIRLRASKVAHVLDPVEASSAAYDARVQWMALSRLSLGDAAAVLQHLESELVKAAGGVRSGSAEEHATLFEHGSSNTGFRSNGPQLHASADAPELTDVLDADPAVSIRLSDGTLFRASARHRFDIVRVGAPYPQAVTADELQEGDQVLLVRGDHQRTLSDLLLEDMDSAELRREAELRKAWARLCHSMAMRRDLTASTIARGVRENGGHATPESVRWWLRGDADARTPNDWRTFLAFSTVMGLELPVAALEEFFSAIRRWRIGHRKRGRDVVRLLRLAWFGGLSAADLARVEERWGLGVRDLIEGSRVAEVEQIDFDQETPEP